MSGVTKILVIAHGTPEILGCQSRVWLSNSNGDVLYRGAIRVEPNPYDPQDPTIGWDQKYFRLAAGIYSWQMYNSPKHGRVPMLIGEVPGCGSKKTGTYIEFHPEESDEWPGSAGCQTIPKRDWPEFISHFEKNDFGFYELERTL